jgi:hypothetical protein
MPSPHARFRLYRKPLKVFCSSTYVNFENYRSAVEDVLTNFESRFVGMEYFGARTTESLESCLPSVKKTRPSVFPAMLPSDFEVAYGVDRNPGDGSTRHCTW